jgi:phage protein U
MLFSLGSLSIEVAPFNVHEVYEDGSTEYALKPVVGAEPLLEFVGEGPNEISLSGKLFPIAIGGLDELELLKQMRVSGKPQYLMRGDGTPQGWFAITHVSSRSSFLGRQGVGRQIDVSISLTRSQKPSAQSFFSLVAGLI